MKIVVPLSPKERARGSESPYLLALVAAGAGPSELLPVAAGEVLPEDFDGLMLTGGADVDPGRYGEENRASRTDPPRDAMDVRLLEAALGSNVPVLAICRGMQMLNVALGGSLYQDLIEDKATERSHRGPVRTEPVHSVELTGEPTRLSSLVAFPCSVNSLHHQGVRSVSPRLRVTARAVEDGIVEALEPNFDYPWLLAVQWHPEEMRDHAEQVGLLARFVDACRQHSTSK